MSATSDIWRRLWALRRTRTRSGELHVRSPGGQPFGMVQSLSPTRAVALNLRRICLHGGLRQQWLRRVHD